MKTLEKEIIELQDLTENTSKQTHTENLRLQKNALARNNSTGNSAQVLLSIF